MNKIAEFKKRLSSEGVIGCFSKTTDSSIVESMGHAGMDYVILDMEHGPITTETLKHHLMALNSAQTLGIVRVDVFDSELIGKALDLGAHGIQVPSINKIEQAREAIARAKFFPSGDRGVCRFVRAAEYSNLDRKEYFSQANESLLILQLEGEEGLSNFDEIITLDGIDIIFIGPYDLSQSLGVPGEIEHPKVKKAIADLTVKALSRNVVLGTFCDTSEQLADWKSQGIKYLSYSVDIGIFTDALKALRKAF